MEDEDTLTPDVEPVKEVAAPVKTDEDEVLEAEILEAVLVEETVIEPVKVKPKSKNAEPATLMDIIKRPQVAAALMTLIILGAGGYYYINNQLEPFTADQLRYGDEMRYTVTEGTFVATEEYVSLVLDQLDSDDETCKIRLEFEGDGTLSITEGGTDQLLAEGSTDRLGAVIAKAEWEVNGLPLKASTATPLTGSRSQLIPLVCSVDAARLEQVLKGVRKSKRNNTLNCANERCFLPKQIGNCDCPLFPLIIVVQRSPTVLGACLVAWTPLLLVWP